MVIHKQLLESHRIIEQAIPIILNIPEDCCPDLVDSVRQIHKLNGYLWDLIQDIPRSSNPPEPLRKSTQAKLDSSSLQVEILLATELKPKPRVERKDQSYQVEPDSIILMFDGLQSFEIRTKPHGGPARTLPESEPQASIVRPNQNASVGDESPDQPEKGIRSRNNSNNTTRFTDNPGLLQAAGQEVSVPKLKSFRTTDAKTEYQRSVRRHQRDFNFPSKQHRIRFIESLYYGSCPGLTAGSTAILTANYLLVAQPSGLDTIYQNFNDVDSNEFNYTTKRSVLLLRVVAHQQPRVGNTENPTLFVLTSESRTNPDGSNKEVQVLQAICVGKKSLKPLFQFAEDIHPPGSSLISIQETGQASGEFEMALMVDKKTIFYCKHICKEDWFKTLSKEYSKTSLEHRANVEYLTLSFDLKKSRNARFALLSRSDSEYCIQGFLVSTQNGQRSISRDQACSTTLPLSWNDKQLAAQKGSFRLVFDSDLRFCLVASLFQATEDDSHFAGLQFLELPDPQMPDSKAEKPSMIRSDWSGRNPFYSFEANPVGQAVPELELQTAALAFEFQKSRHCLIVFGVVGSALLCFSLVSRAITKGGIFSVKNRWLDCSFQSKSPGSASALQKSGDCLMALGSSVRIASQSKKVNAIITVSYGRTCTFDLDFDITGLLTSTTS